MTTLWAEHALLPSGWAKDVCVDINGTRITHVTTGNPPAGQRLGILLPAPANAHSHAFQRAMAGLTEARGPESRDTFWTWRRLMYRFLDLLDPDHIQAISALAQIEMLEAGYASCAEFHYVHHAPGGTAYHNLAETGQRIAAAASETGIGLSLLPVHYEFGGCDGRALQGGQLRFGNDFDQFAKLVDLSGAALRGLPKDTRLGVAAHSLRAIAPADLPKLRTLAGRRPFHMHLAEQQAEVDEVQACLGARPVQWVLDHVETDDTCVFVHCTQMGPEETTALARSGAIAAVCPVTEANLGDGIFPGTDWQRADGRLAVGTDSNVRISLAEELRMLEYSQRLRDRARAVLADPPRTTGRTLFEAITSGGASAAGRDCGAIANGKLADLVALNAAHTDLQRRSGDAWLDSFVFAGNTGMITDLWSAGRHMVREGRHILRDRVVSAYRRATNQLVADL
ncbi:MAG: formimidoylglutamate deiminase [Pseudomonadota bacterium]